MNRDRLFPGKKGKKRVNANPAMFFAKAAAFIVLLLLTGFAGIGLYNRALSSPFFSVKSVRISPMILMKEDDIREISGFVPGENIFVIDTEEMERRLETYPWISRASVEKKFPDSLSISVSERLPFALVRSDRIYLVDRAGFILSVLGTLPDLSLPVIIDRSVQAADAGDRLESPAFSVGRKVIMASSGKLFNYESEVASVELLENGKVRVLTGSSGASILLDRFSIEAGLEKLKYMRTILKDKGVREVDLSFKNQAVVKREGLVNLKSGNLALAGELPNL